MESERTNLSRRKFIGTVSALGSAGMMTATIPARFKANPWKIIKPPRIRPGDTLGIITPASPVFEPSTIREGKQALEALGFKVKIGRHVGKKNGYLAGSDKERADDLMRMFADDDVKGIVALRGGYGSLRIVSLLDYDFIKNHPKILLGYSDISTLLMAIHQMTGLVTFHGPVALSTFTEFTRKYFFKTLMSTEPVGKIENPPEAMPLFLDGGSQVTRAGGYLVGGNLSLIVSTLGTPFEIETEKRILFFEEVGEEPYHLDRFITQLLLAGKLQKAAGILIDRCKKCGPSEYKPAFNNTSSVEEVFSDRLAGLEVPILFGASIGHVADKPILPLGIQATLDVNNGILSLDESAVT